ncbi:DUF4232 domain-containing protein [Streptomyces sp. NPDC093248]|uniref:DUF4232 domain-containing protein n=1 Tax=Streptomyces sp. NPDC093248 TaxID=3155072 RepID=UPI003439DF74
MQHRSTVRVTTSAAAVIAAVLSLGACQSGDEPAAGESPATAATAASPTASAGHASTPTSPASAASGPAAGGTPTATAVPASPVSHTSAKPAPPCPATALKARAYQAADRPDGTGTGAAVVEFTNVSGGACVLRGHPTVAGAGNGSPEHNTPLSVTPQGAAAGVPLAPGGKAWVKLTFVQVQGEGDGYCASGAEPAAYPTLVIGLPGAGAHQVALDDGVFAECDNTVTATAVTSVKPV